MKIQMRFMNIFKTDLTQGGGGGTPIFSYICWLRLFFAWFKTLNFNIFGVLVKIWQILLGHHKTGIFLFGRGRGVIYINFRAFLKVKVQNWNNFGRC